MKYVLFNSHQKQYYMAIFQDLIIERTTNKSEALQMTQKAGRALIKKHPAVFEGFEIIPYEDPKNDIEDITVIENDQQAPDPAPNVGYESFYFGEHTLDNLIPHPEGPHLKNLSSLLMPFDFQDPSLKRPKKANQILYTPNPDGKYSLFVVFERDEGAPKIIFDKTIDQPGIFAALPEHIAKDIIHHQGSDFMSSDDFYHLSYLPRHVAAYQPGPDPVKTLKDFDKKEILEHLQGMAKDGDLLTQDITHFIDALFGENSTYEIFKWLKDDHCFELDHFATFIEGEYNYTVIEKNTLIPTSPTITGTGWGRDLMTAFENMVEKLGATSALQKLEAL